MTHKDLFQGIVVVIDDKINEEENHSQRDRIHYIVEQLKGLNIPYLSYKELPSIEDRIHFHSISFIILDWELVDLEESLNSDDPLESSESLKEYYIQDNIDFINSIKGQCFAPIFIFTNEDEDEVKAHLKNADLYFDGQSNYIFVRNKSNLRESNSLINEISVWIEQTPSIYILKKWEKSLREAKTKLFYDFFNSTPSWPRILWKAYKDDGVEPSTEINDVINRNIVSRMKPLDLDKDIITQPQTDTDTESIAKIITATSFIGNENLYPDTAVTGDLFRTRNGSSQERYWLNIRPNCDTITRNSNKTKNSTKLYCLLGKVIDVNELCDKKWLGEHNNIQEPIDKAIVFFGHNRFLLFKFKDIHICNWGELKTVRGGRIIPPYITKIQQRYALYIQRQGLPKLPEELMPG